MSAPFCLKCRENWLVMLEPFVYVCPSCRVTVDEAKLKRSRGDF